MSLILMYFKSQVESWFLMIPMGIYNNTIFRVLLTFKCTSELSAKNGPRIAIPKGPAVGYLQI
jgi:hypothetical protein